MLIIFRHVSEHHELTTQDDDKDKIENEMLC